jgi:MoxR-like ATPase
VWWGRIAKPGAPHVGAQTIERINDQLERAIPTYAFLYRQGEVWRTRVRAVSASPPDEDDARFPNYYRPSDCNFFALISEFEPLPRGWAMSHLLLARNPDPARLTKAFGNQTTPLHVYERWSADTDNERAIETALPRNWMFQSDPKQWSLRAFLDGAHVGQVDTWIVSRYRGEIQPGDDVLLWEAGSAAGIYAVGQITGEAEERPRAEWRTGDKETEWVIPYRLTRILELPLLRDDLRTHPVLRDLAILKFHSATNFPVTEEQWEAVMQLLSAVQPEPSSFDFAQLMQRIEDGRLIIGSEVVHAIVAALRSGKHVMLTGAPGTAKTALAQVIGAYAHERSWSDGPPILTTATADWTTYETVGGLRPIDNGLEFRPGQLLSAIQQRRWLVIDELNRSNFDRAFGQLFTVLSGQPVVLPFEDPPGRAIAIAPADTASQFDSRTHSVVVVPETWRIIATMNVFDKSLLFEMSFALMRRFAFIELPAPDDATYEVLIRRDVAAEHADLVAEALTPLMQLRTVKGLGPALFMDMARFASASFDQGATDVARLRYQLFYSFLLPQFEGIDDEKGRILFDKVCEFVPRDLQTRLHLTLTDVLGVQLPAVRARVPRGSNNLEEDSESEDLDYSDDESD